MVYEWDAVTYSQLELPHMRWGNDLLAKLPTNGIQTILEVGCGTGRDTEKLALRVPNGRVIAVDYSESMLGVARKSLGDKYPNIEFRLANILEDLGMPERCDAAFSVATLHWVGDHDKAFSNIAGALKPGGVFLADCGGMGNIASINEVVISILGPSKVDSLYHFEDAFMTEKRLEGAGFQVRDVRLLPDPARFDSIDSFKTFIATLILGAHLANIDPKDHDDFLSEVAGQLPGLTVDYVRLRIDAVKM